MSDIFISYARSTEGQAKQIAEALHGLGYGVWRDDELPAHRAYAEVIQERLTAAKVVVVVWSAEAVKSEWVQSEADRARGDRKLVQLRVDDAALPMPFDRIQCADMSGWTGDLEAPGWRKVAASVAELIGGIAAAPTLGPALRKRSICVLPFANMSGDPEQEYFSDGISEDIITDLSKVSALLVIARNTAFGFKGKSPNVKEVAHQLDVSHVLEGSVRKAGGRVRITAQLIDGATGGHLWAERYDRELTDIFALQDEISEAVVEALKLRLLPEEKKAIEQKGTNSPEAYSLYLMARRHYVTGNSGDPRREATIIRLTRRAVEVDPAYARAWALMAMAQWGLRYDRGSAGDDGQAAAERALELDPSLAMPHAVKAVNLAEAGRRDEAFAEIQEALRLDPESSEVHGAAGRVNLRARRLQEASEHLAKATALDETNFAAAGMLGTALVALGDRQGALDAARICLARAETVVARDPNNGHAMAFAAGALAVLGEAERAREWTSRALLIDPDNPLMRYNFACMEAAYLHDPEAALDLLEPVLAEAALGVVGHAKVDPDLDPIRDHPRFKAMIAAAEKRLAVVIPTKRR